jgi:hypothetical protein
MNDNNAYTELPEFATRGDRLAHSVEIAREAASFRLGYEVELACLEPVERDGHLNTRVHWRRKLPLRAVPNARRADAFARATSLALTAIAQTYSRPLRGITSAPRQGL